MTADPRWRAKLEALQRAGLEYIARVHLTAPSSVEPNAAPIATDSNQEMSPEKEPALARKSSPTPDLFAHATEGSAPAAHFVPLERTPAEKVAALRVLAEEVAGCPRCAVLAANRTQTVFSDGSPQAELCFVGEAPGADEDAQGVPFVGKAGQLLTRIIEACKLKREEVYICNVLKCRPPGNRNPLPDEVENCRPYLERQLALVQPKMMVALGKFAAAYLLNKRPEDVPITRIRGQIHEYCGIPFMITLHPAYLLRNPAAKRDVWDDMKVVMRRLGRPVD